MAASTQVQMILPVRVGRRAIVTLPARRTRRHHRRMKHLFLVESGSHNLRVVDPDYPVFVLGGVIVDGDEQLGAIDAAVRRFKGRFFARRPVTLHTADTTRARNGFEVLRDPAVRGPLLR